MNVGDRLGPVTRDERWSPALIERFDQAGVAKVELQGPPESTGQEKRRWPWVLLGWPCGSRIDGGPRSPAGKTE
jgi:hypothetical protein